MPGRAAIIANPMSGRDVRRLVLARAVRLFAEDRIVLDGSRTIVFG